MYACAESYNHSYVKLPKGNWYSRKGKCVSHSFHLQDMDALHCYFWWLPPCVSLISGVVFLLQARLQRVAALPLRARKAFGFGGFSGAFSASISLKGTTWPTTIFPSGDRRAPYLSDLSAVRKIAQLIGGIVVFLLMSSPILLSQGKRVWTCSKLELGLVRQGSNPFAWWTACCEILFHDMLHQADSRCQSRSPGWYASPRIAPHIWSSNAE